MYNVVFWKFKCGHVSFLYESAAAFTDTPSNVADEAKINLDSVVTQTQSEYVANNFKSTESKQSYYESSSEMIVKEPATNLVNINETNQASVPIEITSSEQAINEQEEMGPGRKEHFETFVRPSLSEDDDSHGARLSI